MFSVGAPVGVCAGVERPARPSFRQAAGFSKLSDLGRNRAGHDRIQPLAGAAGRPRHRCPLRAGRRHGAGRAGASAGGVLGLRAGLPLGPRSRMAKLAPPRSVRPALLRGVRAAAGALRGLWRPRGGGPVARPRARHTRDFEDLVAFMAQQMAKTPITVLLRIGWDTVCAIVARVVADRLDARPAGRAGDDRRRRDQLPPRAALPHPGLRSHHRRDRVGPSGPQRRHPAGVLRRARRARDLDPGGLNRHERRL